MIRLVIDTNLYISAAINQNSRSRLNRVLENGDLEILTDTKLLLELHEVINRSKFSKYLSSDQIHAFLDLLNERCEFVFTKSEVAYSPDPKDNFLLALCRDGKADFLLTGDKVDLLALREFEQTKILSLTEFLNLDH